VTGGLACLEEDGIRVLCDLGVLQMNLELGECILP
jgi:hypothetical protein